METLTATLSLCRKNNRVLTLNSKPFNDFEITPENLQKLGERLIELSKLALSVPTQNKKFKSTKLSIAAAQNLVEVPRTVQLPSFRGSKAL